MSDQINESETKKIPTPLQDMVNETQKDSTIGPMIGSLIVILIVLIGGLYFLGTLINQKTNEIKQEETKEEIKNEIIIEQTLKQSESEDINSIEADLEATDLNVLDEAFKQIEEEI